MNDYHNDVKRISNSMLSLLNRSPELYKLRYIDGIVDDTKSEAMILGSLVHCLALEPHQVDSRYSVAPICDRRTKVGKSTFAEFALSVSNKTIVTSEQMDTAKTVSAAILQHRAIQAMLCFQSYIEHRIDYDWDGIACRSLLDFVTTDGALILDIKTTQDASPDDFAKSVVIYGYHRQAVMYRHAVEQTLGQRPRFIFAAASTQEPYTVACYELDNVALDMGRIEVDELLEELKRRTETNDWTSEFTKGINLLSLPRWYK